MAKKNRSVKPAIQGAQQTEQEQQLDERLDTGDVQESNEGALSGAEETGAVDGDPGVGEAGTEGSDAPADLPPQEEGLVGDESHAPQARGMHSGIATLEEASFLAELDADGNVIVEDAILQQPGIEEVQEPGHKYTDALLDQSLARLERPEIDPDYVGQIGFDPATGVSETVEAALTPEETEELVDAYHGLVVGELNERLKSGELSEEVAEVKPVSQWTTGALRADLESKVGKDPAAAWSREQMLTYLETGAYPKKTHRQNWVYDARRTHNTKAWSSSEMLDFIDGNLVLDKTVNEAEVWEEAYRRWKAPSGWTLEAFREYVYGGTSPALSASGVLLEDRQRDQKLVHHLTYRELRAALLGEITVPHDHAALVSQLRKRLGLSENHSEQRLLEMLPTTSLEVSMDNTLLRAKLEEYQEAMTRNPGTLTEATAGACQGMLYKAVRAVIKREYNEFVEGWNIILDFVNEQHAALFTHEKRARGWSQVNLSKQQLQLFEDLMTLIIHTREPGNRAQAAKLYNLEIVLRHLPEENERQNLFLYYGTGQ